MTRKLTTEEAWELMDHIINTRRCVCFMKGNSFITIEECQQIILKGEK